MSDREGRSSAVVAQPQDAPRAPLRAAVLGTLLLSEPIDGWMFGAIVCIGAGLWLATRGAPVPPR